MKFYITNFFNKCDQIHGLLKKYVIENFIFLCSVSNFIKNYDEKLLIPEALRWAK